MNNLKLIIDLLESNNNDFYITCNGKIVRKHEEIREGSIYHIVPRLVGGKGGFGSMLRAIGAQIDKTNNREACRDLSGRRMRDVNNEKQLKEWVAKKAEQEKEREEKRRERMERRRALPNHKFEDPLYDKQKAVVAENQEDALQTGLQRAQSKQKASCTITSEEEAGPSGSGLKRKRDDKGGPCHKVKKHNEWLGIDIENLSDLDSDEESDPRSDQSSADQSVAGNGDQSEIGNEDQNEAGNGDQSEAGNGSTESEHTVTVITENTSDSDSNEQVTPECEANLKEQQENPSNAENKTNIEKSQKECQKDSNTQDLKKPSTSEPAPEQSEKTEDDKPFDFDDYSSVADLEVLGLEKLKSLLMERGMKCGGTLQQWAERLFSVKGLDLKDINPSLLAKPSKGKGKK
ncbi:splicing regulator SDE2-like [Saccostrea echinata]|uniref:splicing regulator SDE2-like n=1 Tax=Saccostrea echinata TaxID=191078 RepID=UPI002A7F2F5D|nr:splicing regulator SDE2-like [Saccostrea echinata]